MEREGFKHCMENINEKGRKIMVVATDHHVGIRADMKKNFPEVDHQFDVWHLSKSITGKLRKKKRRRKNMLISLSGSDPSQTIFGGVPKHVGETRRC